MERKLHRRAAGGAWFRLELVEQLGNVGGEVERAILAHRAGRTDRFRGAFERALELFELTAEDPRWHGHRCQEILRAREEFCRLFFDPEAPTDSADGLRKFFFGFAYAARMVHYRRAGRSSTPTAGPDPAPSLSVAGGTTSRRT